MTAEVGPGSYCAPANSAGKILFANDFLTNESDSLVEITSVTLNDGDNLSVRDFSVGYGEQGDFLGGSTPDQESLSGTLTFEPGKTGAVQVVLGLDDPERAGYASSLEVRYLRHLDKSEQSLSTIFEIHVVPHGKGCEGLGQTPPTAS